MPTPKMPKVQTIPERQALKLPDGGATGPRIDDETRRRRAMSSMLSTYRESMSLGSGPSTTKALGG